MGNAPLASPDMESAYGRTTEQIDGVLTLKKSQALSTKSAKQRLRGLVPSWQSSRSKNKRVKSLLMRSILVRDWQKVLIRARLFPCEVHEFDILEVPLFIARDSESHKTVRGMEYCRVRVLPIHVACALRPPPEVVRALLSHAVGAAISSSSGSMEKSFGSPTAYAYCGPQQPVPLHHEDNTSFAAVGVQRLEALSIGKTIANNGKAIANKLSLLAAARRASFCEKKGAKLRLLCSTTEEEDEHDGEGIHEESPNRRENAKEVDLFLKRMEDHLAHNGRSVFRDATPETKSCSPRSVFVLDFDPLVLLPSPSAVRMMEKQTRAIHPDDNGDADLFSLENSIGDSDTAMTTSTPQLVGIRARSGGKNGEESSSLEYLTDDSSSDSSASSSLLEPPSDLCDDSDDRSNGSNSFLQLTADGNLEVVGLEDDTSSSDSEDSSDDAPILVSTSNSSESSGNNTSDSANTNCQSSSGLPSSRSCLDKFVPEDIRLNPSSLFRSLPPASSRKRADGKSKGNKELSNKRGHEVNGQSRLLPLHIACLYGASAAILKLLLEEYPEGSSIEVLGMLPIHMVAANWSLAAAEELQGRHESGYNDSMQDRLAQLVDCAPKTLWANSAAHGLRPLEYTRILLCYPANVADEGLVAAKNYLDSQERHHDRGSPNHLQETAKPLTNDKVDVYCNHPIEATSTCTTSGISSAWMANDSSSAHSSSISNSHSSSAHSSSISNSHSSSAQSSSASNSHSSLAYSSSSASKCTPKARQVSLVGLLCQSRWEEAMSLLKTNPETAKERNFSNSNSNSNSNSDTSFSTVSTSSSSGLKEILPIHMACQIFKKGSSIPIYLVQSLVLAHPEGLNETDDDAMSGSLPLHLICESFRRRHHPNPRVGGSGEEQRVFVSERLQVLKILLTAHPEATHVRDNRGRMPLHTAVLARAPVEAIRLLVHRDPQVVSLPDKDGSSPFYLATKMYASDSPVMILLKQAWI